MNAVNPRELANVCASFGAVRARRLACSDLEALVRRGLALDCDESPAQIIAACLQCGLITQRAGYYLLSRIGRELSRHQGEASPRTSEAAKAFLLRELYLNPDAGEVFCFEFVSALQVDTERSTFFFERSVDDKGVILDSLRVLDAVGLIEVFRDRAFVRAEYLALVNECLRSVRNPQNVADEEATNELNEVGELAEGRAVEDERERLIRAGYPELAPLVKRISTVDRTAGYDVISHRGAGSQPDAQIFIEVKGTRKPDISFVWSQNERAIARVKRGAYWLYLYTAVDLAARTAIGPFRIHDPIRRLPQLGFSLQALDVYVCRESQRAGIRSGVESQL